MFEYWVREQDNNIEGQNWEVLSIVDNFSAHSDIGVAVGFLPTPFLQTPQGHLTGSDLATRS